jgi:hypothetical protein
MPGTKTGGKHASMTNRRLYGEDYYGHIGSLGGRVKNPNKGFGRDDRTLLQKLLRRPKRAAIAGRLGGRISRRRVAS